MATGAIKPPWFLAEECGVPRMKEQKKKNTKEGLGKQERKKLDPYCPSLPHVVTIIEFQVLLSSVTRLPS